MVSRQATFFDLVRQRIKGKQLKHEGMEASYEHANSIWKDAVVEQIHFLISHGSGFEFTSDDILVPVERQGIFTKTNTALGAIIKSFERTKQIKSTGIFKESNRASRHRAPLRVWKVV